VQAGVPLFFFYKALKSQEEFQDLLVKERIAAGANDFPLKSGLLILIF
jgi:hypothetical protein